MKFKLHIKRLFREATDFEKEVPADEKDIIVTADSCCEAVVHANKLNREYIVTSWKQIED